MPLVVSKNAPVIALMALSIIVALICLGWVAPDLARQLEPMAFAPWRWHTPAKALALIGWGAVVVLTLARTRWQRT